MKNNKSFTITSDFDAPIKFKDELIYYLKRYLFDIIIGLPIIIIILFLLPFKKLIKKKSSKKIILGTVPIIIFKTYNDILKKNFDTTLYATEDWSKGSFHNGLTLKEIAPSFISKYPYFLGSYYSFFWAILNFELYFLYFNSGFLERTIWWRVEPILYQLFDKKVIIFPYGSDAWTIKDMDNLKKRYGLSLFNKKYFDMDSKIIKRNYWWSKYVNAIFSLVDFVKFLPRFDILTLHGHILLEKNEKPVFKEKERIKIIHFANDEFRKGSQKIKQALEELSLKRDDFDFEILFSIERKELLKKIEDSDIIIDTFVDGFLQYTTLEAAIKAKVVFSNFDDELTDFFTYINNTYYDKHFKEIPIINYTSKNLEEKLEQLLDKKETIRYISEKTYDFALNIIEENEKFIIELTEELIKKRY